MNELNNFIGGSVDEFLDSIMTLSEIDMDKWNAHAQEKDAQLQDHEFRFKCHITHMDGSVLYFPSTLVEEYEDVVIIYTEHCGFFVFPQDEVDLMWKLNPDAE